MTINDNETLSTYTVNTDLFWRFRSTAGKSKVKIGPFIRKCMSLYCRNKMFRDMINGELDKGEK